jgi:O-antigen/teichoic acid export membrane protein
MVVRLPSLRGNFSWTLAGNVIFAASQFGMLIILARLGGPDILGQFALALAITAPIFIFLNLKLRTVQATDAGGEYEFPEYFALRAITAMCIPLVVMAIVLIGPFSSEMALLLIVMSVARAVDALGDIVQGLFQRRERMSLVARSLILRGAGSLFAFGISFYATGSIIVAVAGMAVTSALVFLFFDLRYAGLIVQRSTAEEAKQRQTGFNFLRSNRPYDFTRLRALFLLALPLGITVALGSLWTTAPRYLIEHQLGTAELGIFAAITSFLAIGTNVINALSQSATPRLANLYTARNLQAFDLLLFRLCGLGLGLGVLGVVVSVALGRHVLYAFYGAEYSQYASLLTWLMVVMSLQYIYVFLGTSVNAMRMFTVQLPIHAVSLMILVILCFFLVNSHGLIGVVWAMLASNVFEAFAYTLALILRRREVATSVVGEVGQNVRM